MERLLKGKITSITAIVIACFFLLWSGGSLSSTIIISIVVLLYILLPGIYICIQCGIKEQLPGVALPVGVVFFGLIYLIFLYIARIGTEIDSLFYALPPLIGGMGLFTLIAKKAIVEPGLSKSLSVPAMFFSVAVFPLVAIPVFTATPLADIELYSAASALNLDPLDSSSLYNLIASAIVKLTGQSGYSLLAFYLPLLSLLTLCVTIYSLADRVLKNRKKTLFASIIFLIASPVTFPGYEGGFSTAETLLFSGEQCLNLAIATSVILTLERTVASEKFLTLIPSFFGFTLLCIIEPTYAAVILITLIPVTLIHLISARHRVNLYLLFLICLSVFLLSCYEFYTEITITSGLPQGLQMDSLLRDSYIISPILYYALLPVGFVISVLFALLPILPATVKNLFMVAKRIKSTGFASLFVLTITLFSGISAFIIEGKYETLGLLCLLCGSILAARMFDYKGFIVKLSVIVSIAIGTVNLGFILLVGITAQLQSFGYIEYTDEPMMEPMFYQTTRYIRENTQNSTIIATNHPLGEEITSALTGRVCIETDENFYNRAINATRMKSAGVDYLLLYDHETYIYDDVTVLYAANTFAANTFDTNALDTSSDDYIVVGSG